VLLGEVVDIDVGTRLLVVDTLDRRTAVPYDSPIVAAGASQSYFGHPEFALDAPGMKTIDHALELEASPLGRLLARAGRGRREGRAASPPASSLRRSPSRR
jgi:NADH dehydrogenase